MTATRRMLVVWILLLVLTFSSVGIEQGDGVGPIAAVVVISIAMLKVKLIGAHFMDLRAAPRLLQLLFDGYVAVVLTALLVLVLFGR